MEEMMKQSLEMRGGAGAEIRGRLKKYANFQTEESG